jgi:polyhydroxybutyrate depolymerase
MKPLVWVLVPLMLLAVACSDDGGSSASSSTTTTSDTAGESATGCGAGADATAGTERLTVAYDGVDREVERTIPPAHDGDTPLPLLVSLHGFTSTIDQLNLFSDFPRTAAERGYVVVVPQAADAVLPIGDEEIEASFWNAVPDDTADLVGVQDDVGFLNQVVDDTVAELCIDPDRVFVAGNSNGAAMSVTLACGGEGRYAAIAPVSGINIAGACEPPAPVSVIAFHGDTDPLVPYEGGSAASVELDAPSVEDRVGELAAAASCDPEPDVTAPFDDIEARRWTGCDDGVAVELVTVLGGGHTWPGMLNYIDPDALARLGTDNALIQLADLDLLEIAGHMTVSLEATTAILDFFDAHPRVG